MKPIVWKTLIVGALGLTFYTKGCNDGYSRGYVAGQNDISQYLEDRVATLGTSFPLHKLQEYAAFNVENIRKKEFYELSPLEQKEFIACLLALNEKYKQEKH